MPESNRTSSFEKSGIWGRRQNTSCHWMCPGNWGKPRQVVQNPAPRAGEVSERIKKLDAFDLWAAMLQHARHISQSLPQARRDSTGSQGFNRHHVGQPASGTCTGTGGKRAIPAMLVPQVSPPQQ
jgi:hypothetical protein